MQNCANGDCLYFLSNLLTPVGNFRDLQNCHFWILKPKLGSLNRNLYVDFKNGLKFENSITKESVDPYSPLF